MKNTFVTIQAQELKIRQWIVWQPVTPMSENSKDIFAEVLNVELPTGPIAKLNLKIDGVPQWKKVGKGTEWDLAEKTELEKLQEENGAYRAYLTPQQAINVLITGSDKQPTIEQFYEAVAKLLNGQQ